MKYPKIDQETDWQELYSFTNFVINSKDKDFVENIWKEFNLDNFSDYFIFLNLIRATDNLGKNIYVAKYNKGEPYYYIPWDLDGCFGTIWDGSNDNRTDDILTNGLIERVLELEHKDFYSHVAHSWFQYRMNVLSNEVLEDLIVNQFDFFSNQKVYEREALVYPSNPFDENDLDYMMDWLDARLIFLDTYFTRLKLDSALILYPNPASTKVFIKFPDFHTGAKYEIQDFTGKVISQGVLEINYIPVENLSKGVYFLKIGSKSSKFIVN